jgi:hypothetical protein
MPIIPQITNPRTIERGGEEIRLAGLRPQPRTIDEQIRAMSKKASKPVDPARKKTIISILTDRVVSFS